MALARRETPRAGMLERLFEPWPEMFRRPFMFWPSAMEDTLAVEEYRENGTLVVKAEMPGIDPAKDVEVTVTDGMLHIGAERHEQETTDKRDFYRRELRYGSFSRDLMLPEGVTEADVKASYKDGILEVRVPVGQAAAEKPAPTKIPVTTD